ncbi:RNA-guided endonuclease TnpB family protein [Acrocarpospora sp. B8E8]|uniref:RNA-guided endonuclease TnpB family protein n=1 Tax=Acrocarpospora sp. B8E8 TaxID=3153572 RepID=UPI00325D0436
MTRWQCAKPPARPGCPGSAAGICKRSVSLRRNGRRSGSGWVRCPTSRCSSPCETWTWRTRTLARLQRDLSRKEKGSKNREKVRIAVARQHAKVGDARQDFLHQTSTSIIRENQTVVIEDLAVRGLARGRLANSVNDASWGAFRTLLGGKAARYGRTFISVDRWFPSSQLCPCCGRRNGQAPLRVREWDCPSCGEHHDRDLAAALDILAEGLRLRAQAEATAAGGRPGKEMVAAGLADTQNDCGGRVRPAWRSRSSKDLTATWGILGVHARGGCQRRGCSAPRAPPSPLRAEQPRLSEITVRYRCMFPGAQEFPVTCITSCHVRMFAIYL